MAKKKGLGMGLEALLDVSAIEVSGEGGVRIVPIMAVEPNPEQPRKKFDDQSLALLSESIKKHGILQPLLVKEKGDRFLIIAGERRWRAARLAGLEEIPVLLRSMNEEETFEVALIENLQREDLSPMEMSRGYRTLMDKFGLTQEEVATRVGRSRPAIANSLRLMNLPPEVIECLETGRISEGHARALVGLEDDRALELAELAADGKMTVRQLEAAVKMPKKKEAPKKETVDYAVHLEKSLAKQLGRKVKVKNKRIEIEFDGNEDLDSLLERLGLSAEGI